MTGTGSATEPERLLVARGGRARRRDLVGWTVVGLLTILVLLSWAPYGAPLGDDHEGRILGRHAIQLENLREKGLVGSGFASDLTPFSENYSHHPPLMTAVYAVGQLLPWSTVTDLRVVAFGMSALSLVMLAGLLRALRLGWVAVLPAVVATAATPLFWVYGRLNAPFMLTIGLAWAVADLRDREAPEPWRIAGVAVLAAAVVMSNWFGMATAALLGLWLLARRGLDRTTWTLGSVMVVAAAATWAFVLLTPDTIGVAEQAEFRTRGGGFGVATFAERIWRWLTELLPTWYLVLAPPAVAAGLALGRTRWLTLMTGILAVAWVVLFPNGSYVHDYWIFPLLWPVALGLAAAVTISTRQLSVSGRAAVTTVLVVAAGGYLGWVALGPVAHSYVEQPRDAGELVERTPPPAQERAWHSPSIPGPRWLSHAWDLPSAPLTEPSLTVVEEDDLVVLRLDRPADWMPEREVVESLLIDREGRYGLARAGDLMAAAD